MAERWIEAEVTRSEYDAQVAAHDYAHWGWYFRIKRLSERRWVVYVQWGRQTQLRCCGTEKRRYVKEEPHRALPYPKKPGLRHFGKRKVA